MFSRDYVKSVVTREEMDAMLASLDRTQSAPAFTCGVGPQIIRDSVGTDR